MPGPNAAESERVRSYLLAQGEKYGWLELWPRVIAGRLEFLETIGEVSPEQAGFQPGLSTSGEEMWSVAEVAQHVLQASQRVQRLIRSLAVGKVVERVNVDPPRAPAEVDWDGLRRSLREDSLELAGVFEGLPEPPSFEAMSPHPFFGELHARAWYLFQRVHDQDHARQVLAIQGAAGYPSA